MDLSTKLITHETEGELQMIGRIDTNTAPEAERVLLDAVGQFDSLVLDMEQLNYVSSAGLRALKRAHIAMRRKGGELSVKNVNKSVMEVFDITGFAGMLKFI